MAAELDFGHCGGDVVFFEYHLLRNVAVEVIDAFQADAVEHRLDVGLGMRYEFVAHFIVYVSVWKVKEARSRLPDALVGLREITAPRVGF